MYVAVTGASGFIGSHVVAALRHKGHSVRCIVRDTAKTAVALQMHGLGDDEGIDISEADLTDSTALRNGLEGVDAVVHVAAVFSLDPNDADLMAEVNPGSVATVISLAQEIGLSRVVYVSTMGVYVPASVDHIDADTALSKGLGPYTESKVAAEEEARARIVDGAPVVTVYPGGVFGPNDPNSGLSDSQVALRDFLKGKIPAAPKGANLPMVDVRDVATVCAGAVDGGSHTRYLVPGETILLVDFVAMLNEITGRTLKLRVAPKTVLRIIGKVSDLVGRATKKKLPITAEAVRILLAGAESPNVTFGWDPARDDFDVPRHEVRATIKDAAVWMHSTGHLDDDDVGSLA